MLNHLSSNIYCFSLLLNSSAITEKQTLSQLIKKIARLLLNARIYNLFIGDKYWNPVLKMFSSFRIIVI